ncbi:MAG: AAA family ATPase [Angustibacter sp.]
MAHLPITRIRAKNFRSLADVDVRLNPFSVLVGPNGSGKTNVLRILRFLGTTAQLDLDDAIAEWGGFDHIQRRSRGGGDVVLQLEGQVTVHAGSNAPDVYRLTLRQRPSGELTRTEEFTFKRTAGRGRRISLNSGTATLTIDDSGLSPVKKRLAGTRTTALATLPRLSDEEGGEGIRAFATMLRGVRLYEPDADLMRRPASLHEGPLAEDGSNLSSALLRMSREDEESWSALVHDLRRCLPGLVDVQFQMIGGPGRAVVAQLVEAGLDGPVDLQDASFGTVRLLMWLCLLHDRRPAPLVAIEEIDHGLHPHALDILADRLRGLAQRTQVMVSTHSPTFVNRLHPNEIVLCDRDSKTSESHIPVIPQEEIGRILDGFDGRAGELWFAGALGGVPA